MRKLAFLINTHSGAYRGRRLLQRLESYRQTLPASEQQQFGVQQLDFARTNEQLEWAGHFDAVIVAGGDGTIHWLLSGLLAIGKPLGVIPLGLGNDLSRHLGSRSVGSLSIPELLAFFDRAAEIRLPVTSICPDGRNDQSRLSINYFSLGFDAEGIFKFHHLREGWLDKLLGRSDLGRRCMYGIAGLMVLNRRCPELHLKSNEFQFNLCGEWSLIFSTISSCAGFVDIQRISGLSAIGVSRMRSIKDCMQVLLSKKLPIAQYCQDCTLIFAQQQPRLHSQIDGEPWIIEGVRKLELRQVADLLCLQNNTD